MNPIQETLSALTPGAAQSFRNMTFVPLFAAAGEGEPGYLTLDEALARQVARVTEVSERGSVPELRFVNEAEAPVLLVDGEELVGAKQNRVLNVTILVGGKKEVVIPVSCVEQGRWSYKSKHFAAARRTLFAKARAKKMARVSESLRTTGTYRSHQGEIWEDVAAKLHSMKVESPSFAMADAYAANDASIADYVGAFKPAPGQVGAAFAVNGELVGMELFDSAKTFAKVMDKIVSSYAMDAIEPAPPAEAPLPVEEAVRRFIADMQAAATREYEAAGEGKDVRLSGDGLAGGALVAGERVVHLAAFRVPQEDDRVPRAAPYGG
ncbi:MAG: hypothetical protein N2544_17210 [Burkholderiales bacterium]|nr:hypothetical protein [Burkholderiales bacterium]